MTSYADLTVRPAPVLLHGAPVRGFAAINDPMASTRISASAGIAANDSTN